MEFFPVFMLRPTYRSALSATINRLMNPETETIESKLIGNAKKNTEGELIVVLFEFCDLTCQFCAQDHNSILGMDTVREKITIIKKALDTLKMRGKQSVTLNLMGGELFSDKVRDEIFNDYAWLIEQIKAYSLEIGLPVNINIATNLVWTKTDRVLDLLKKVNLRLSASYDPAGRFNPQTLEIFRNNLPLFKDYIGQIGIVMTRPNIEKIMKGQAPHFDYLYENFMIVFDNFTNSPQSNTNFLMPKDFELRDFYKFMLDNWPECYPFKEMFIKAQQPMGCMRTMYVFADNSFGTCGSYEKILDPIVTHTGKRTTIMLTQLEEKIETKWFKDYDCLSCEHMQRCSFSCFLNHHIRDSRTQDECWLKEVYDYIDQNYEVKTSVH